MTGQLLVHLDGTFTMTDAAGQTVVASTSPPILTGDDTSSGITMAVTGSKTGPGATGRRPCLSNGEWGPPYTWDPVDNFFAFAVSPWGYDPDFMHCYPVSFDGLAPLTPPHTPDDSCTTITHVVPFSANGTKELAFIYTGAASGDGTDTCCNACNAHPGCTAWQHGTPPGSKGKNPPNCRLFSCVEQWIPPDVTGSPDKLYLSGGLESQCGVTPSSSSGGYIHQDGWYGLGTRMDWYLAPTPSGGYGVLLRCPPASTSFLVYSRILLGLSSRRFGTLMTIPAVVRTCSRLIFRLTCVCPFPLFFFFATKIVTQVRLHQSAL